MSFRASSRAGAGMGACSVAGVTALALIVTVAAPGSPAILRGMSSSPLDGNRHGAVPATESPAGRAGWGRRLINSAARRPSSNARFRVEVERKAPA
jgi:hypothetical protein